jgi:flagellar biosynthesis protein FlhF
MQLRTFVADDMKAALASVRAEMGDDAVIVNSQKSKGGGVIVRAALDKADAELETAAAVTAIESPQDNEPAANVHTAYRDGLIHRLRAPAQNGKPAARGFSRPELLAVLHAHRAPDALTNEIAEAAQKSNLTDMTLALAASLDKRMRSAPIDMNTTPAILLAGCNGAGKTAVAAKIAAHARMIGRKVVLIASDIDGAGAVARLETFAKHLDAHFVAAANAEQVASAVARAIETKTLAIIDTAGFDPRNAKARTAFAALGRIDGVETIGVLSARGDSEETTEICEALKSLGAVRVIVTGLDIVRRLGALLAASTRGLGLAAVTQSPFAAGALELPTPISLSRAILESGIGNADRGGAQ